MPFPFRLNGRHVVIGLARTKCFLMYQGHEIDLLLFSPETSELMYHEVAHELFDLLDSVTEGGERRDLYLRRHETWPQAEMGHKEVCRKIRHELTDGE